MLQMEKWANIIVEKYLSKVYFSRCENIAQFVSECILSLNYSIIKMHKSYESPFIHRTLGHVMTQARLLHIEL